MTRAKQAAMKAYPPTYSRRKRYAKRVQSELVDTHQSVRALFQKGYEQAEKDTIERAIAWLKEHANDYIVDLTPTYPDAPVNFVVGGKCWDDLKEYMENE